MTAQLPAKILITRPDPEGHNLAQWLRARIGIPDAVIQSPVMRIEPMGSLPPLSGNETLVFTSKHALRRFVQLSPRRDLPCYVVGAATAALAKAERLRVVESAPTAKKLLSRLLSQPPEGPLLYLRGAHISTELLTPLRNAGISAHETITYKQEPISLNPKMRAFFDREQPIILPLYSLRSATLFFRNVKRPIVAPLYVAAISDTVGAHVADIVQPTALKVATYPDDAAMRVTILELWAANRLER